MARLILAALAVLAAAACSSSEGFSLEGSPQCARDGDRLIPGVQARVPDDEGIATAISHEQITIDGERAYGVSDALLSFSTYDLELEPVLGREGQYVHVGLDGDDVVWLAGIAHAVDAPGGEGLAVYYTGTLAEIDDDRAIFCDGTTFGLAEGAEPPVEQGFVQVRVDPATDRAVLATP